MELKKVLLVEDHPLIIKGLKLIFDTMSLNLEVSETDRCDTFLSLVTNQHFEYCIVDLNLLDGNAIDTIDNILKLLPETKILVYTSFPSEFYVKRLFKIGIVGFLNKKAKEEEIKECLNKFFNDEFYVSEDFVSLIFNAVKTSDKQIENPFNILSTQEMIVVEFLLEGSSVKLIAEKMSIMSNTVATYKKRAFQKLEIENILQLDSIYKKYKSL
jgi:two-component system, NarL family, invasion response regulator UvrY